MDETTKMTADLIVYGKNLYRTDSKRSLAQAMAVADREKIIYVGDRAGAERYAGGKIHRL